MGNKTASSASDSKLNEECETSELLDSGKPRIPSLGFTPFPRTVSHIVLDYLSDDNKNCAEAALLDEQPITFCLSQEVNLGLAPGWYLGFLQPDQQWRPVNFKVDKRFSIMNHKACLRFLNPRNSIYCRVAIEVLIVKLKLPSGAPLSALVDLRKTIEMLYGHLKSIKHVVISITRYASCCFTLTDTMDAATGVRKPIDRLKALLAIIDDLDACWKVNNRLTAVELFALYFKTTVALTSEVYLAKFVISLNSCPNRALFKREASRIESNKIMLVYHLRSFDDFNRIDQDAIRVCDAIFFDTSLLKYGALEHLSNRLKTTFCYRNNPSIERIVADTSHISVNIQLPRPNDFLTYKIPFAALVELTLKGSNNTLHLTQLNNGYFPQLEHLFVTGGVITGHLDSHCVPRLKTLRIQPKNDDSGYWKTPIRKRCELLVYERTQSLICIGRPWQLVASQAPGGWSLASYDEFFANPQDEKKENSNHSSLSAVQLIRELILVANNQQNADEWQLQLQGHPSAEAAVDDHNDRILMWAPECVEKMTVLGSLKRTVQFDFHQAIPDQVRILTSLACYSVQFVFNGAALPYLQSLELRDSSGMLSGAFPKLKVLSFEETSSNSQWRLDAPLLESLHCIQLFNGRNLSLSPHLLPYLSVLQIVPQKDNLSSCPKILIDKNDVLGLSRVRLVVLAKEMTRSTLFHQFQVHQVSHLTLCVNPFQLPASWSNTVWQCETLELDIDGDTAEYYRASHISRCVVLPQLPRVKTLTVKKHKCRVLLNTEMPQLIECTISSPSMLGSKLRCPALKRIRFTDRLPESEKKRCLDPVRYFTNGAQLREVIFAFDYQIHTLIYDIAPSATGVSSLSGPFEDCGNSYVSHD